MISYKDELLKQLIELKDKTMEGVMALSRGNYNRIENYISILEYCIINLNPEAYLTIIKTVEFVADKYCIPLFCYETLAEEIQIKRDKEESKLYPEDLTDIKLTLYRRTTNGN